jgi:hypothetical protein
MVYSSNDRLFIHNVLKYSQNFLQIAIVASCTVTTLASMVAAEQVAPAKSTAVKQDVSQSIPTTPAVIPQETQTLTVGLMVNGKNILSSINIRGKEDGEKAVEFDRWLVPFDEVMEALKFKVDPELNGKIEISSALFKFPLPVDRLVKDPQIGRSIAIKDLNTIPGITAKFNLNKYAIDLVIPTLDRNSTASIIEQPILVDGLPVAQPAKWGIGAIQERINVYGQNKAPGTTQGELKAVGNILDANWYLRVDQPQFDRFNNWNITDAVVIRQRPQHDLVIGSQSPFWRRQGSSAGSYWGGTSIWREGFTPPVQLSGSDFSVNDRLQSSRVARSIVGQAFPGTLVQLVRGTQVQVLQEALVDNSGFYRFDNIIVGNGLDSSFGQDYRVLIYPNGQLTANPEIRPAQFSTTPGQLPTGASALVVSGGANRITTGNFGDFDAVQGGALYRRGVSESLTVGVGAAFDRELVGVGDIFWQPNNIPLQVAVSATTGKQWDVVGRLDYRPSNEFFLTSNLDQFSSRTDANWQLTPNFTAIGSYDSLRGTNIGGQYQENQSRYSSTYLRAEIDNRARLRFGINQRLNNWQFSHQSNDAASTTQAIYNLSNNPDRVENTNELVANYQTNSQANTTNNLSSSFTSLVWRYRSPERTGDGRSLWQSELGYGFNNIGNGLVAGIDFNLLPGLRLRGSYRGASENGRDSYALELTSTLLTSGGIQGTDARIEDLRAVGQIELTAFYDTNANGRRDPGEQSYYDPLLFKINQKPLKNFRVENGTDLATIKLPPDTYRLDIDPSGYPVNYRGSIEAMRVDIVAGNLTKISVPLVPAYVYTGTIQDTAGQPVAGAKVEAISIKNGAKLSSITNDAGVYYLEGLEQGEYKLTVSGLASKPDRIRLESTSKPVQELNLSVNIPTEPEAVITAPTSSISK